MGSVDEPAQTVRPSVAVGRRVEGGAVVAPAPLAREVGEGHEFDGRHAEVVQVAQPLADAVEGAGLRERADVELVDDEVAERGRGPVAVRPGERARVDDLARPVDALRLEPRGRVGKRLAAVEREAVAVARGRPAHERLVVPVAHGVEQGGAAVEDNLDALGDGRPDAEPDAAGFDEGSKGGGRVHGVGAG